MIVCPVCENNQAQGTACDVCGMAFSRAEVGVSGHSDPAPEPVPGLEHTAMAPPDPVRVAALGPDAPCVWCGHRQVLGTLCDRCGMQRHRGARKSSSAEGGQAARSEPDATCRECGLPGTFGGRCQSCGSKMPTGA